MKIWQFFLLTFLPFLFDTFAQAKGLSQSFWDNEEVQTTDSPQSTPSSNQRDAYGWSFDNEGVQTTDSPQSTPSSNRRDAYGWSFDIGGQYTWMSFSTPPTFTGSTGGVQGKITYQAPKSLFSQFRTVYNEGSLSSSLTNSGDNEWYTELVAGYCFCMVPSWTITPYAGIGVDFLNDHKKASSTVSSISLHYRTYYALFGFATQYSWKDWYLGLQADCLPIFNQYLGIGGIAGTTWKMHQRVGADVRIPVGYRLTKGVWLELAPYYRYLPIGGSSVLDLIGRNLNQVGFFLTFRFFI